MKKFFLYAGAVALSIASFAVISAFKNRSVQDEGGHYVIVKTFQNVAIGEKSYALICYGPDKTETVDYEYEPTLSGYKERQERRTKNIQTLTGIFEKVKNLGYHLTSQSAAVMPPGSSGIGGPSYSMYLGEIYVFEK